MARPKENFEDKFWDKVEKTRSCWLWAASKFKQGYGQIKRDGKNLYAHRASYELHFGEIPEGKLVCHHCDVKLCVNPLHLFLGTWKDNVQDMIKKGRRADTRGDLNGMSKLSGAEILKVVSKVSSGKMSQNEASAVYGLSQGTISAILCGKKWNSVTGIKRRESQVGHARGEGHGVSVLTEKKVLSMRRLYESGKTQAFLAAKFGVSNGTVSNVVTRKYWSHV